MMASIRLTAWRLRLFVALSLFVLSSCACAWGAKGHAAVAALAESALSASAKNQLEVLLADDLDRDERPSGRRSLAAVASWADEIRDVVPTERYRGWHVRPNPVCSAELGACRDGFCVDQLILLYATILADPAKPLRARNEALKWLVHLVGDLHQPLHAGMAKDRGNLPVLLSGEAAKPGRSLHQVWDSELAVMALERGALALPAHLPAYAPELVEGWVRESRDLARDAVYGALPGFRCDTWMPSSRGGAVTVLDAAYQAQALPVIRLQLERAASRLAALLNALLH